MSNKKNPPFRRIKFNASFLLLFPVRTYPTLLQQLNTSAGILIPLVSFVQLQTTKKKMIILREDRKSRWEPERDGCGNFLTNFKRMDTKNCYCCSI